MAWGNLRRRKRRAKNSILFFLSLSFFLSLQNLIWSRRRRERRVDDGGSYFRTFAPWPARLAGPRLGASGEAR